ncbi:MAG: response regulator [Planctomycetales bacterium]|nr:response regulator [Planctomycetales bacterium]
MSHRILVCDDESHITLAVSMKLTRAGFQVTTASDGQAAWEIIQRDPPDLLLTDCQMPRLDGIGLCRLIRQHETTRHLPILMLTAKGYELDAEMIHGKLGIAELIVKPFSPRELLQTVENTLAGQAVSA